MAAPGLSQWGVSASSDSSGGQCIKRFLGGEETTMRANIACGHQRISFMAQNIPDHLGRVVAERLADTIDAPLPSRMQGLLRELAQAQAPQKGQTDARLSDDDARLRPVEAASSPIENRGTS
jgi:hypothetical protein